MTGQFFGGISRISLAATVSLIALSGFVAAADASTLRVRINADIRSIDPGVNRDDNTDSVILHVVEGLVAYGVDGRVKPLLAQDVNVSDDGLSYTFRLREGVTFHNGDPLTADDVVWSWNRYMAPETEWRCLNEFDGSVRMNVTAVEAVDDSTVVFTLEKPSSLFLASMARTDCGMTGIISKASLNDDGSFDKPVGTGPFKFAEWRRGEYVRLEKFAEYSALPGEPDGYTGNKTVHVDDVRFLIIPDGSTAKAALQRGDIDILPDVSNMEVRELGSAENIGTSSSSNMGFVALLMQTRDPLLKDVRLRQAIAHAIETPELVAAVTDGFGSPNNSVVPTLSPYYTDVEAKGFTYDPARAQELVAEAGYSGQPLTIIANKRYASSFDSAIIAQQMLMGAGINAQIEVLEWATQLDRYQTGNFQIMALPYSARFDPALNFEQISGNKDVQPRKVWDNKEALAILDESMVVSDSAERQVLFDKLHEMFLADAPMVPLYNGVDSGAFRTGVEGYQSTILSKPLLWGVTVN